MAEAASKFFLTTPIYYVNARPHIGHAYTTIVADVLARRHRLLGDDTYFLTGTDEHGQKIERSALSAGIPPKQFADQVSAEFPTLWDRMGLTYDQFIRTTDPAHKRGVQKLFAELQARGHIYLSSYTGQYCVSEEIFVEGLPGTIGPDGRPTETVTEENYFFRSSAFQLPLLDLIESDTLRIRPESRKNEILSFLVGRVFSVIYDTENLSGDLIGGARTTGEAMDFALQAGRLGKTAKGEYYVPGALRDLSISRSSFTWGIPVPDDEKHVIYVWLDALANYMTAVGYGNDSPEAQAKFARYWPADLHIVGKEITRQHCIYWPAFLLALNPALQHEPDEPMPVLSSEDHNTWAEKMLPKEVVAHGWLLFEESKMSKSKGNIVRTETILDAFGTLCPPRDTATGAPLDPQHKPVILSEARHPCISPVVNPSLTLAPASATQHDQDLFAADVLRYFLLREIPFGQDGSFSFDALITRYNADLANGYGNLVSRTLSMIQMNCGGTIPQSSVSQEERVSTRNVSFSKSAAIVVAVMLDEYAEHRFTRVVTAIQSSIGAADTYFSENAPWKLAKSVAPEDSARLQTVLYTAAEAIRIITALLYPILPYTTASVWRQLGLGSIEAAAARGELKNLEWGGLKPGTKLGPLSPIFPRADKGLAQIMSDMEQKEQKPIPSKFVNEPYDASAQTPVDATHPAAAPRTGTFSEPSPGLQVAGSTAETTERQGTPSHHEANPSGIFSPSQAAGPADASPQIAIDDFAKVELRVAQILIAERIPKADKLLRLEVDLGYEKRQILSGIAEWYTPEELIGRRIVVITNLAPRKMRGLESHGMLLAASNGENGKPVLATFSEEIALGSRLK